MTLCVTSIYFFCFASNSYSAFNKRGGGGDGPIAHKDGESAECK